MDPSLVLPLPLWHNNRVMSRQMRFILFLLAILVGIVLGLLYGWEINPVKYVDTTPNSLSEDYKTDYVLMVAEIYHADGDLAGARTRLEDLGKPALESVQQAILSGEENDYISADLEQMRGLASALQNQAPPTGTPGP